MATSLKHEAFHKNLECPICLSFFKEPNNLTCSHTFCKGCLETLLESRGKLLCPTCREETSVPGGDTEAVTSHKATCQQLEGLLNQIRPDEELPRRTAEEGERIGFRSQGSEGLKLGQLRQKNSKSWILRTEAPLPYGKNMNGMAISPHNEMASVSSTRLRSEFVEKTLQVLDHFQSPVFRE
ncbi:E3 ubiquitin-protein ligase SH3RF1-like [Strongylocentrotus purpuratus]|uniref:RING-type domain-containing protein n=1 Tax=Strongylocentrotus purpuratus TaxID=7668 RepID=A0A7M7PCY9_STRPU|nr:E3 ubiquitin-protein ligase SH3RF1-like [Strongylocentrotus purpuratus]